MQTPAHGAVLGLTLLLVTACDAQRFTAETELDTTFDLEGARAVRLRFATSLDVEGGRRGDELTARGRVVVATSSQAISDRLAAELAFEADAGDPFTLTLAQPGSGAGGLFPEATLEGTIDVELPDDVDLAVESPAGSVRVSGMEGDLDVRALGAVTLGRARGDVVARSESGGVQVALDLPRGSEARIAVRAGTADVTLPGFLNARIRASTDQGTIFLENPALPPRLPGQPYDVIVGSGDAEVTIAVGTGDIRLR